MKILYGVPGEGMGHATRSKVVGEHLLDKGHDICIVSSGRAFRFLENAFPGRVVEIKGFHFALKNGEISKGKTFFSNFRSSGKNLVYNTGKKRLLERSFPPDLVITDFESFSYFFAKEHRLPIISIDNMQVMDRCRLEVAIPGEEKTNYRIARGIVKAKVPGCDHYLVSSFFPAEPEKKNTTLVPPILRKAILDAKPGRGDHILVYQSFANMKQVLETLLKLPNEQFRVYGMNRDQAEGNVRFRPFSEKGFIADLAGAKAVVANGGYSFISEAIYLRKPVYAFPIRNQFEQWLNAAYIEKCGYGRHFSGLDADSLKAFVYDLQVFEKNLSNYHQAGNKELFAAVDRLIAGSAANS